MHPFPFKSPLIQLGLTLACLSTARAQFSPVPLTPGSFTQDIVVEKGASPPLGNFTTATIDQGTNNYGNTFFEQGYIASTPELGLPPHGSTFVSRTDLNHTFLMPPSYVTNNCALVAAQNIPGTSTSRVQIATATLTVVNPTTAYKNLSILYAGGGNSTNVGVVVHYADNSSDALTLPNPLDWFNGNTAYAWIAGGRVALDGSSPLNNLRTTTATKLFNIDLTLVNQASPVTSVDFNWVTNSAGPGPSNYRVAVFGISGSTDGVTFSPIPVSGFNADAVVEAGVPCPYIQGTTVTIEAGPSNSGNTWYEQGFATVTGGQGPLNIGTSAGLPGTGSTGLPHPGATFTSGVYTFQMPSTYVGNDCFFIGNYAAGAFSNGIYASPQFTSSTINITSPQPYTGLSILGSSVNGPVVLNYTITYSDATTQSGTISIIDWTSATTAAFSVAGRVAVDGPALNNVNATNTKLFHHDIALNNTTASANSIALSYSSGGRASLLSVSAQSTLGGNYNPIAVSGYNADVIVEKEQPYYPGGLFTATTATMDEGTNNCNFTWFERGWMTNGAAIACGLPPANTTVSSLQAANRVYVMPPSYTGPNSVLIDTNHQLSTITPVAQAAATAISLLTGGGTIGGNNIMTNFCIIQHANGVSETNAFYGYDWFNTAIPPAFSSNGRGDTRYHSVANLFANPQVPKLFETFFALADRVSPITNIVVGYKLAGGNSWTTYVLAVSASTSAVPPILGQTFLTPAITLEGPSVIAQATETGDEPITNQWQYSADGVTWVNLTTGVGNFLNASDVANAWGTQFLTNTTVGYTNSGQYRLVASNIAGTTTNAAATLTVLSGLADVTQPTDPLVEFEPGGEPVAEPTAETFVHVIDNLVGADPGKWLTFGPGGNTTPWNPNHFPVGFVVTPALGKTTVSAIRFYTANDTQARDPSDYGLEGSNDGGNTWTKIAGGPVTLPAGRNNATSGPLNPLTQFIAEVHFPNATGYLMYRWSCTNVQNNATSGIMQIGEIELLGVQTPTAPIILAQSSPNVKTYVGSSPTFFVTATGFPTNLNYQWSRDNGGGPVPIGGATSSSYTLAGAQLSDSGAIFSCFISNTSGSTNSANSTLTVIAAPTTPYATTVMNDAPVAYFRLDEGPDDGTSGGNNGVVAFDTWGGHNGFYTNTILQVAGYSPNDSDTAAYFGKSAGPYIPTTGVPDSCVEGAGGITFEKANASAAMAVEAWVMLDPTFTAGGPIAGAGLVTKGSGGGGEQFALDCGGPAVGNFTHTFRFYVRDAAAPGSSRVANGLVGPEPGVWHHVVGVLDDAHSNVVLYVDGLVNGTASTITATNGLRSSTAPVVIGARQQNASTGNNLLFYGSVDEVALYNQALSSNQVMAHFLAAGIAPRFTTSQAANPTSITVSEGASTNLSQPFYGSPTLSAQWYLSTDGGATFNPMGGQTSSTLTLANVPFSSNNNQYRLTVSNTYGTTNSVVYLLTVNQGPPQLLSDVTPAATLVYASGTFSIQAQFGGTLPITYQWYLNGSPLANSSRIIGAQSNILTIASARTNDIGNYQVFAHNAFDGGNPTPSGIASVIVETMPDFNVDGSGWSINGGGGRGIVNGVLTLTDGTGNEATSAFYNSPVYIGAFTAGFTYQDVGAGGADGAAFVLQNDPRGASALGGGGGSLGLVGITPSIAMTMNIYANASGGPGMSFGINGAQGLPYTSTGSVGIDGGDPIDVSVVYRGGVLSVAFTDELVHTSFTTNVLVDIPTILGANSAYVGITGADGGTVSTQTITNFYYIPLPSLSAQNTSTNTVLLSWPSTAGGFSLLQKASVLPGSWTVSPAAVTTVNGQNQAVITPVGASGFYRLILQTTEP